jgi:hypothetical protein
MQRPIYFCKKWFAAKKYAPELWTEAQAKEAHDNGRNYTVLVDSLERPFCAILVMANGTAVDFLDECLREALSYQFQVVSPGQLFLTMAVHREFDGNEDKVAKGTMYTFTQEGKVHIRRETFLPTHSLETADTQADVSSNYVPFPQFGEYEELVRMERQP